MRHRQGVGAGVNLDVPLLMAQQSMHPIKPSVSLQQQEALHMELNALLLVQKGTQIVAINRHVVLVKFLPQHTVRHSNVMEYWLHTMESLGLA